MHLTAPEHGENVSIVGCGNALGQAVPPLILFKGKRLKPEWTDHLPPGSKAMMTLKGSMTNESFIAWLEHFAAYKNPGSTLLIFDGAKSHLDISIVEAAENHAITLFCPPSNTTHELQPMDKAVFKSYEVFWDQEVLNFLLTQPGKTVTKMRFGEIFTPVWLKAMTPSNIISGFRATGIYPLNPDIIPEAAFAPSLITHVEENPLEKTNNFQNNDNDKASTSTAKDQSYPTTSVNMSNKNALQKNRHRPKRCCSDSESSSESDYSVHDNSSDDVSALSSNNDDEFSKDVARSLSKETNTATEETPVKNDLDCSFKDVGLLITPEIKIAPAKRKPVINSRAQEVTKKLFSPPAKNTPKNKSATHSPILNVQRNQKPHPKRKLKQTILINRFKKRN